MVFRNYVVEWSRHHALRAAQQKMTSENEHVAVTHRSLELARTFSTVSAVVSSSFVLQIRTVPSMLADA